MRCLLTIVQRQERKTVSKHESEGLTQLPRFVFSTFCIPCVFYLLQVLLCGLPELLGPGFWWGCVRNPVINTLQLLFKCFLYSKISGQCVSKYCLGEVEKPVSTLQGEAGATWTHEGVGDWHELLKGKKMGRVVFIVFAVGWLRGLKCGPNFICRAKLENGRYWSFVRNALRSCGGIYCTSPECWKPLWAL